MVNFNRSTSTDPEGSPALETTSNCSGRLKWRALWPVFVGLALLPLAFPFDLALSRWCLQAGIPGDLRKCFNLSEVFGHGVGVLMILVTIHQLDATRRWALPRIAGCAYLAGLIANLAKLTIVRWRPGCADLLSESCEIGTDVWATFGGWFPGLAEHYPGQSFPSAHTATAVALAFALTWYYPAGRRLFPVFAVLVGCQRINSGAHYLSDVVAGAAVGLLIGALFFTFGPLPAIWDRWESRWRERGKA